MVKQAPGVGSLCRVAVPGVGSPCGSAVAVGGLEKLASVFTVGGLCVDGCRTIWAVVASRSVSLALNALTRCELQRACSLVLRACNGLLEWRRT